MVPRVPARFLRAAALAGALVPGALPGQDSCTTCRAAGLVPCAACAKQEGGVDLCSVALACRVCRGAGAAPCADCSGASGAGAAALAQRRERAEAWLAEQQARGQRTGPAAARALHCRTSFFDLTFALDPPADAPVREPHALMHTYAERITAARAKVLELLGIAGAESPPSDAASGAGGPRLRIAIVSDMGTARRLAAEWTSTELQGLSAAARGAAPSLVLLHDSGVLRKDAELHRLVVHHTVHAVLAALTPEGPWPDPGYGWLDEGLAHACEAELGGGICEHCCYLAQGQPPPRFFGGNWRIAARELLEAGALLPLPDLIGRSAADLDLAQHAACFAVVEFLRTRAAPPVTPRPVEDRVPLRELVRAAMGGRPPAAALQAALGVDAAALDPELRAWIRATFPRR